MNSRRIIDKKIVKSYSLKNYIMKEKFAAKNDRSCMMRFHTQTAASTLTAQDLDNNLNTLGFTEASLNQQKARVEFSRFLSYAHNQQKEEAYDALNARKNYAASAMSLMEVDDVRQRDFDFLNARNEAWYHILFGEYNKAEEQLDKLYYIASKIQDPSALDNYNALSGMVRLFSGDAKGALLSLIHI